MAKDIKLESENYKNESKEIRKIVARLDESLGLKHKSEVFLVGYGTKDRRNVTVVYCRTEAIKDSYVDLVRNALSKFDVNLCVKKNRNK